MACNKIRPASLEAISLRNEGTVEFLPISELSEQHPDRTASYPEKGNDPEILMTCSKDRSHRDHNGKGKRDVVRN
jgi:hypothetical protein